MIRQSLFLFLVLSHCLTAPPMVLSRQKNFHILSGKTMGTFYTIKFLSSGQTSPDEWQARVDQRLSDINRKMSMFDPRSQLSLFNRQKTGGCVKISPDFLAVLRTAEDLHRMTRGAWDGTVKPLVDLWGFGTQEKSPCVPGLPAILEAQSRTGFRHIRIRDDLTLCKDRAVTLDLGSIAKGYGVDALARMFLSAGIQDLLIEIGGELYASGHNKNKKPWTVGITRPDTDPSRQSICRVVRLDDRAIATSGNYRNFFKQGRKSYSHIIDPRTGYPVDNGIVSASVIAKTCTLADGLATALMIMDTDESLSLINTLEDTECLILKQAGESLEPYMSSGFPRLVAD